MPPHPRRAHAAILVLVAAAWSGCLGSEADEGNGGDPTGDPTNTDGGTPGTSDVPITQTNWRPDWKLHDWWTYTDSNGASPTFVVSGQELDSWTMDTTDESWAFYEALDDVSILGPQRKVDLAGSQGDERVEFFDWPLADEKTWLTTWDGEQRRITTTQTGEGEYAFDAKTTGGTLRAQYAYTKQAKWFTNLEFFDESGTSIYSMSLSDSGANWTGDVVRYELDVVFSDSGGDPVGYPGGDFEVTDEHTDVFLVFEVSCTEDGFVEFITKPTDPASDDQGFEHTETCPHDASVQQSLGHTAGSWTFRFVHIFSPQSFDVNIDLVLRTRVAESVG